MELRDFVAETIKQVIDGVITAQEYAKPKGAYVNPKAAFRADQGQLQWDARTSQPIQTISFDVAVTAAEGTKTQGGIAVLAGAFALGSKGQSDKTNETLNRIQFSVGLSLPVSQ